MPRPQAKKKARPRLPASKKKVAKAPKVARPGIPKKPGALPGYLKKKKEPKKPKQCKICSRKDPPYPIRYCTGMNIFLKYRIPGEDKPGMPSGKLYHGCNNRICEYCWGGHLWTYHGIPNELPGGQPPPGAPGGPLGI